MIEETSFANEVADELDLTSSAYAEDVAVETDLTSAAYAEDVAQAINDGVSGTLTVLQYNIGHFNMGTQAAPTGSNPTTDTVRISYNKSDGWAATPKTTDRNYDTQKQRWKDRISGIDADIIGMPEWNNYFGWMNINTCKATADAEVGIFADYNLSVGKSAISGWWQNTLALKPKYTIIDVEDKDLGSTNGNMAYVRIARVKIRGKIVKIAVTHLNWNNPLGATADPTYSINAQDSYDSRQVEIKNLVKLFKDDPYVILCGDFNTQGPVYGPDVPDSQRNFLAGLDEFDPFVEGFTEDGVTYPGNFTLANNKSNPLKTAPATNARPDTGNLLPRSYLDNIIVRGFTMSEVHVIDDGSLTDHFALYCDLTIVV